MPSCAAYFVLDEGFTRGLHKEQKNKKKGVCMSKRETLIRFFYKGEEIAKAKRVVEDLTIITKYYNPKTNRWVKFSTFCQESELDSHIIEKIKISYLPNYKQDIIDANDTVKVLLDCNPSVVLGPSDKLIDVIEVNEYAKAEVILKNNHYPTIYISDVNPEYDALGKTIRSVYKVANILFKKMHQEFINALNDVIWELKRIVEKTGKDAIIEFLEPTIEEPRWYIDVALDPKSSEEVKNYPKLKNIVRVFKNKKEVNKMRKTITIKKGDKYVGSN